LPEERGATSTPSSRPKEVRNSGSRGNTQTQKLIEPPTTMVEHRFQSLPPVFVPAHERDERNHKLPPANSFIIRPRPYVHNDKDKGQKK